MWQRIKNIYHLGDAVLANLWFGFPSRNLIVIGVTGTDGKTTTTSLIYHILHTVGYDASMISSVGAIIGGKAYDVGFHVTTPSPWALQRFIKKATVAQSSGALKSHSELDEFSDASAPAVASGDVGVRSPSATLMKTSSRRNAPRTHNYLVIETTSHALDQYRVWGIKFDIGVLTNVTHEHLDYHKTYENYVSTKAKLLKMARVAVVNRDDKSYRIIKSKLNPDKSGQNSKVSPQMRDPAEAGQFKNKKFITYGMEDSSDINPRNFPFETELIGEFNRYNSLAAIAVCRELGISDSDIRTALKTFKPPVGRQDIVYKNNFTVMIDFAHTPNAFEVVIPPLRKIVKGRIIHVFGSAGERDRTKRPIMGKISSKYADIIVLTSEDPRSESANKIMNDIELGIKDHEEGINLFKIPDRKEAIESAIEMAARGDIVLITGKSHEKSMNYGKGEIPWDEYGAVRRALRLRKIKL